MEYKSKHLPISSQSSAKNRFDIYPQLTSCYFEIDYNNLVFCILLVLYKD